MALLWRTSKKCCPEVILSDADGVVTNDKADPSRPVIERMVELDPRMPTVIITGRSDEWLKGMILPIMEPFFQNRPPVLGLSLCEYGGSRVTRTRTNGYEVTTDPPCLEGMRVEVESFIRELSNPSIMCDPYKKVVITVVATHAQIPGSVYPLEMVTDGLGKAGAFMTRLASASNGVAKFEKSTYACDLVPVGRDKAYAAYAALCRYKRVFNEMPPKVHIFGDSLSDYGMTQPAVEHGIPYNFYFTGKPEIVSEIKDRYLIVTNSRYDAGTMEVL